jgi:fibronectin-binding autotransporter adhesin
MRSRLSSWNETITKLGFKRKKRKSSAKNGFSRPLRMEGLEARHMLTIAGPVDTLSDVVNANDGYYSLREAINDANGNVDADVIQFAEGLTGTIVLDGEKLPIVTQDLTIDGPLSNCHGRRRYS